MLRVRGDLELEGEQKLVRPQADRVGSKGQVGSRQSKICAKPQGCAHPICVMLEEISPNTL